MLFFRAAARPQRSYATIRLVEESRVTLCRIGLHLVSSPGTIAGWDENVVYPWADGKMSGLGEPGEEFDMSSVRRLRLPARMDFRHAVGLAVLSLVLTAGAANATTLHVNGSCGDNANTGLKPVCGDPEGFKATIQAGINAAVNGDVVMVADGTYTGVGNKELDFGGRQITVRSASGPTGCIIDCQGVGPGFYLHNGETNASVVQGFTITRAGIGISAPNAAPTITECTLRENNGRGVYGGNGIRVSHCRFIDNSADTCAGMDAGDDAIVTDCEFVGNFSEDRGGGLCTGQRGTVNNCWFERNIAFSGGGDPLWSGDGNHQQCFRVERRSRSGVFSRQ